MANNDLVSVSSDGRAYTVSSSSGRAAARVISVMSSNASWPETIEHIESSGFDRQDPLALHEAREEDARTAPAGFEQEDSLALREAREEAARMALEVSAARLRHQELELEATRARLQLLEARERSYRASPASISSLQGSAPTPPAPPVIELPIDDRLRPPTWTADRFGQIIPPRSGEDEHRRLAMAMGRPPQRVDMSPDRAWWMEDQDPAHHREDTRSRPEVRTHDPKDDRIKELEEKIMRLRSKKAEPVMTTSGSSQGHAVQDLHARAREATLAPPTGGVDVGAGVGSLHTMLESVFITPPRSDDLIDLGSPRHARGIEQQRHSERGRADELLLPRNLDADMHRERVLAETARPMETVNLLMLTPPRARDVDHAFQVTDTFVHTSDLGAERSKDANSDALEKKMDELSEILRESAQDGHGGVDPPPGLDPGPPGLDPGAGPRADAAAKEEMRAEVMIKEEASMKLLALPEAPRLTQWQQHLRDKVVSVSGRGDEAFLWIREAENMDIPDERLTISQKFASVDAKLAAAFNDVLRGRIGTIISDEKEKMAREGRRLSGRQTYRMILRQYAMNRKKGHQHDVSVLENLVFPGDGHLEAFLDAWDEIINNPYTAYPDVVLEQYLFKHLKGSSKMAAALVRYRLADEDHPDRSYQFLHHALTQYVVMEREDRNAQAIIDERNKRLSAIKAKATMPSMGVKDETSTRNTAPAPAPAAPAPAAPAALKKKKQPCYGYREGHCVRGDKCQYLHDKVLPAQEIAALKEKRAGTPCRRHAQGICKYGDACQYLHSEAVQKTAACTQAEKGEEDEYTVNIAVPASSADVEEIELIMDTGTENHLVARSRCLANEEAIYSTERPMKLQTANGIITANERVNKHIPRLGTTVDPLVLDNTVDALSVGRLVLDDHFSFFWPAGEKAYLVDRDGRKIELDTKGYVPVIKGMTDQERDPDATCLPCDDAEGKDEDEPRETREERLKREATSPGHLLRHHPKNPYCWVCGMANIIMAPARRITDPERMVRASAFGEHVCADHIVLMRETSFGLNGEKGALFILDMHSKFPAIVPVSNKSANEVFKGLRHFLGETVVTKIYTDNSKELIAAAAEVLEVHGFHGFHQTATPHRPQSNAHAERGIKTVLTGARAALLQSGLPHRFWPWAASHQAFAVGITASTDGSPSPWWVVHGHEFPGRVLPFGALVHYRPPRPVLKNLPKFAPRTIPGIFMGWHIEPGCRFRGDYYVLPLAAFKVPNKRVYEAHRVKEMVSFDSGCFPLQREAMEELIKVDPVSEEGPDSWPRFSETDAEDEGSGFMTTDYINAEYREVVGCDPSEGMSYDQKLDEIQQILFGDFEDDDGWGNFGAGESGRDAAEHDSNADDLEPVESQEMDVLDEGSRTPIEEPTHEAAAKVPCPAMIPRAKRIRWPKTPIAPARAMVASMIDANGHDDNAQSVHDDSSSDSGSDAGWHERLMSRIAEPSDDDHPEDHAESDRREAPSRARPMWCSDAKACKDKQYSTMVARASEVKTVASSRKITPKSNRKLVEFCCSAGSVLGHSRYTLDGCVAVRLTIENDLTTAAGLEAALQAVRDTPSWQYLHVWAALPCTGGSPWQNINRRYESARKKIEKHLETFYKLADNFLKVAREVVKRGGDLSFEWPSGCSLWKTQVVQTMLEEFAMNRVDFHGCAAGLKAASGAPIKKPWTVATTSAEVFKALQVFQCPGTGDHAAHAPCAGAETKKTELYTRVMADAVHNALKEEALTFMAANAMAVIPEVRGEFDEAEDELMNMHEPVGHRPRIGTPGLWCTMITKTLSPGDPLARSPPALQSIDKELKNLRSLPAWDEVNVSEADGVKREFPAAHFAKVFAIVGIKHFEDLSNQVFKGRVVLSGDQIKTATGDWAIFQEMGTVPSNMTACRILLAVHAMVADAEILQTDCTAAYTQADMTGPPTYVRLPKAWWPPHWSGKFRDPVCKLLRALYGHPRAGDIWGEKLEAELLRLGFRRVDGWPSVFIKESPDSVSNIVFIVYVDDLVMVGGKDLVGVIKQLRQNITMDDPTDLQKYLGCVHEIHRKRYGGERVTSVVFNMTKYVQAALDQYAEFSSQPLTKAASPHAPSLADEEIEKMLAEPGVLAPHAASLVMKLMYAARMACPHISTIVSKLASRVTRWTKHDDRRLHRVYCFLKTHGDLTLKGSLSTEDYQHFTLVAWPDADYCGDILDAKSTSGFHMEIQGGAGRRLPIAWGSKKQSGTARSTPEAELLSLDKVLATELIPAQELLQEVLRKPVNAILKEDNAACIVAVQKGYSPTMRHMRRQHKVSISHLHETIEYNPQDGIHGRIQVEKASSEEHRGDLYTKELDVAKYVNALRVIQVDDSPALQDEK